jgi:hypothetical protein
VIRKIAYLLGAGATHAELLALEPDLQPNEGLLISDVSTRVMLKASLDQDYLRDIDMVSGRAGSLNIELLISLIENSKISEWSKKTDLLKKLIREDIAAALSPARTRRFFLHKALLEFHQHETTQTKETLVGLISLNYDAVIDLAYKAILGGPINYSFSREMDSQPKANIPLLKLHGSFNWNNELVLARRRNIEIIQPGSTKSYLHAPYGFIWNRALDLLTSCDSLRVIGCSLGANDVHLVDLLFRAQLERRRAFDIEIVAPEGTGETIRKSYGFFRNIKLMADMEIPSTPVVGPINPFLTWLQYTGAKMLTNEEINATRYLRRVTT